MVRRKGRDAQGALLPGYTDLQEIGGGAFATVFRAVEVETGRSVALKILKLDTIHAHLIETFQQEIQALAAVSDHPNIVTLYRPSTTSDGRPVLVLELCRASLGEQLRVSGPLSAVEATRVGIKIAGALETAHRNGFLHRDMKPQNILITQFGEPALADFGVAALQASAQMTAGVFGFTTLHAAPEVLEGHHLSPATDVYGLASTMYQLLTGQAPFATFENEAPASVILRILRDPVRPLRAEHIPLDLADLLESALSKEPEGRPRSAAQFAVALQQVEAAQGWPETSFVAWGEEGAKQLSGAEGRGPMGVRTVAAASGAESSPPGATRPDPLDSPADGGVVAGRGGSGSAGGGAVSSSTGGGRSALPPLLPPPSAGPPVAASSATAATRPRTATASSAVPASAGLPAAGLPSGPPPAGPPPPPAPPVRPSLAEPESGTRNVVAPVEALRGMPVPPAPPGAPPQPKPQPGVAPASAPAVPPRISPSPAATQRESLEGSRAVDQPTFVDPDPWDASHRESAYEETMGVHQLFERGATVAEDHAAVAARPSRAPVAPAGAPMWAVAAIAVAVVVIVVAALLVAGVI